MFNWIAENAGTIVIAALVFLAAAFAARSIYKERKEGGGCSCGGNCGSCGGSCNH